MSRLTSRGLSVDDGENGMGINRRSFLKKAALATATLPVLPGCASVRQGATAKNKRPNVVLVMTDDQGYGDLHCHGNEAIVTPNLDELHAQSIRLTDFHVDPTCSPTRSALMTGRYSTRTGVWHTIMGRSLLGAHEKTMADVFSATGYKTAIFGKWHLGDNYPFRPQDRGFGEVLTHGGGGVGQGPDYWGNDYFDDTYLHNGKEERFEGYCTDIWFDGALKFIQANPQQGDPFFCYIATNAPHAPYNVSEKYSKPYLDKGIKPGQADFYGMITNIDENMGRLMSRLKGLGLEENTILIFMTDNGTSAGDAAGMRGQKGSEYDGGHRVPFFIRWPAAGLTGGRNIATLSAHIDVLPTLMELCTLKKPKGLQFDGMSIAPLLKGSAESWPDRTILVHSQRIDHPQKWRGSAVMTQRWRLVNGEQLYDIQADPAQQNDIADANPILVEKLRAEYEKWWADLSDQFDKYCEIVIGSDRQNPTRLMSHDWHGENIPWSQGQVRTGSNANGFWAVSVERDGEYEFALRRWPIEAGLPINVAIGSAKSIAATKARIKIADFDQAKPVERDALDVKFHTTLKAGSARLQTWFIDDNGQSRGAFYCYVTRLYARK